MRITLFKRRGGLNAIEAKMTKGLTQLTPGNQHLELVEKAQRKGLQQAFAALPRQVEIVDMQLALAADAVTD